MGSSNFLTTGYSAITIVPTLKENAAIWALSIVRIAPGPLTDRQRERDRHARRLEG
jgi:hypothetical protein